MKIASVMNFHAHLFVEMQGGIVPVHIKFDTPSPCVTNLNTMEWEVKSTGKNLAIWVSASASIPGIFETQVVDTVYYVDGGVLKNLPAQPLKTL